MEVMREKREGEEAPRWRFLFDLSLLFVVSFLSSLLISIRTQNHVLQILSTALSTLASSSLSVFLPTLATQFTDSLHANLLLSLMNVCGVAGQVIGGTLQDPATKAASSSRRATPYYFVVGVSSLISSVGVLGGLAFVHDVKALAGVVLWLGLAVRSSLCSFRISRNSDVRVVGWSVCSYVDSDVNSAQRGRRWSCIEVVRIAR